MIEAGGCPFLSEVGLRMNAAILLGKKEKAIYEQSMDKGVYLLYTYRHK